MSCAVIYLGDGLYGQRDSDGTITLRTQRAEGEHYVVLEPQVLATFDALLRRRIDAPEVAKAVERDLVREIERLRGERDRLADRLESALRNLVSARSQYNEMTTARNAACSIADDAVQLRDDAAEWLAKIDEIRKIGF